MIVTHDNKLPLGKRFLACLTDGRLIVEIATPLDVILNGIEYLNEYMDEHILGEGFPASLSDISYQVVGSIAPHPEVYIGGEVILRVNASVDEF